MEQVITLLALVAIVLLVGVAIRALVAVVVVREYERGLRFRQGRLVGLVGAGTYVTLRFTDQIQVLDVRPLFITVEGQEVLTADGATVKVSLAARYVVADAAAAITRDADFRRTLYLELQLGIRDAVTGRTLEEVMAARRELGHEVREGCADRLAAIGIELLEASVRDVMLSGDLKRAYAGVLAARQEGAIALERARAETAALRSLANAARMLDDHPGLLQLRILQEIGESSGNTVVFGAPEGTAAGAAPARPARPRSRATPASDGEG